MEMNNHKWLSENTGVDIYFAHPYSPWKREFKKNTNIRIRRYSLKKTDFSNNTTATAHQ